MQDVQTVEARIKWNADPKSYVGYPEYDGHEDVTFGIGEWDGEWDDDGIFFWMPIEDAVVGYTNEEWTIVEIY